MAKAIDELIKLNYCCLHVKANNHLSTGYVSQGDLKVRYLAL